MGTTRSLEVKDDAALTVLLIEDNHTDVFVITQVLKTLGLDSDLRLAADGEAAVKLWESMEVDVNPQTPCPALVLLDLNLPRVSGLDVLARIRKSTRCGDVPVVIVTSSASAEDQAGAHALSVSAYFRKPTDLATYMDLAQVIRAVLTGSSSACVRL